MIALRALLAVLGLQALVAGCHDDDWLSYDWDDRRVVCSQAVDDLTQDPPWFTVEHLFSYAAETHTVALLHAHVPGATITIDGIERLLTTADRYGLDYVTYRDLDAAAPPRAALALAFDDQEFDAWYAIRDQLAAHGAKVTFFVTRWGSRTDDQKATLRLLADLGHDVEAHSANHLDAVDYVAAHGVDAYIADEVLPSLDDLVAAGYAPTSYAFPFSQSTDEINAAVLQYFDRVRVGPRDCPY